MEIDILTLFPDMFEGPFGESIIRRAQDKGLVEINLHNLRDWAIDDYGSVDDRPYGGGAGMIIRIDVVSRALEDIKLKVKSEKLKVAVKSVEVKGKRLKVKSERERIILLTPQGRVFDQRKARELSKLTRMILICGHYEGFDERVREHLVDEELSIGEYVLTGGELPAMVVCDAVVRLIPGVLKKSEATELESFSDFDQMAKNLKSQISNLNLKSQISKLKSIIEYPQYTRPEDYNGWKVPEVLLSGNHEEIKKWRIEQAIKKTKKRKSF